MSPPLAMQASNRFLKESVSVFAFSSEMARHAAWMRSISCCLLRGRVSCFPIHFCMNANMFSAIKGCVKCNFNILQIQWTTYLYQSYIIRRSRLRGECSATLAPISKRYFWVNPELCWGALSWTRVKLRRPPNFWIASGNIVLWSALI